MLWSLTEAFCYRRSFPFFSDYTVLNHTFFRAAGSLAESPCRWRVNRKTAELVVDSFKLYFGRGKKESSKFPDRFWNEQWNARVFCILFARTCNIFGVRGCSMFHRETFSDPPQYGRPKSYSVKNRVFILSLKSSKRLSWKWERSVYRIWQCGGERYS